MILVLRRIFDGGLLAGVGGHVFSEFESEVSGDLVSDPNVTLLADEELVMSDRIDLGRFLISVITGRDCGVDVMETGSSFTSGSCLIEVLMDSWTVLASEVSIGF